MILYKHKFNTDVAFSEQYRYTDYNKKIIKLKVRWFNIVNPKNIYFIDNDYIQIKSEDWKN